MNTVHAHLTVEGKPLCQCEAHHGGLMRELKLDCGYASLAAARRAKKELQKHRHSVRVVRGPCPEYLD